MTEYRGRHRGAIVLAVVLLSALTGIVAYNIGLSQGLAQTVGAQAQAMPPYPYGWYRPWGFGFGFPFLFFALIWLVVIRGLWWGGPRWRHRYDAGSYGVPPAFDEWHRQAHERLKETRSADDSGSRG